MKRIALLILTNIAVVVMLGIVLTVVSMLTGINFGQMAGKSLNVGALFVFALVVGFAGSIISLFMSKSMAKMTMGVQLINFAFHEQVHGKDDHGSAADQYG